MIMRRFGAPAVVEGDRYSLPITVVIALAFGLVLGAAAAIGVALSWTEPYWVPEPILILVLYMMMGHRERIHEKALGTAVGAAAAVVVAIIAPPPLVLTALAVVAILLALMQRATYWRMYGLYTFALVIFLAAPGDVAFEAEERGVQILDNALVCQPVERVLPNDRIGVQTASVQSRRWRHGMARQRALRNRTDLRRLANWAGSRWQPRTTRSIEMR